MPNKLFNDTHAKDGTKAKEGGKNGRDIGDRGSVGQKSPSFQTGLDSEGNQHPQFGLGMPGPARKK